jgi:hypothetical protein
MSAAGCDPPVEAGNPGPPEVLLKAPQISVPTVDHASLRCACDQYGTRTGIRTGEGHHQFDCEVVQVADESLILSNNTKDVRMSHGPPDFQWPPGPSTSPRWA